MTLSDIILNVKNVTLAAVLAASINVSAQHVSKYVNSKPVITTSNVTLADVFGVDVENVQQGTKHYMFDDIGFYLDKHDTIPARNIRKPLYGPLVYDTIGKFFCYVYPQTSSGLQHAFRKSNKILTDNGVNPRQPYLDETELPAVFPNQMPEGSVHKEFPIGYALLNKTLTSGLGSIRRAWYAKGHVIESIFDRKEYVIKIYP